MSKLVVCEQLFVLLRLIFIQRSELQHSLAAESQSDFLGIVPDVQSSKEATIACFDCVRFTRWHNVHMVYLIEVL